MKITVFFFLVASMWQVAARGNIDSLEAERRQKLADTTRVQLHLKLAWGYKDSHPEKSTAFIDSAYLLSKKAKYVAGEANSWYYRAIIHYLASRYDSAQFAIRKAKTIYQKTNNTYGLTSILNIQGLIELQQAHFPEALHSFQQVFSLGERSNDLYSMANALNNMAMVYERTNDPRNAVYNGFRSLEIRKKIGDPLFIGESYLEIGNAYFRLSKNDSARFFLLEALPIFKKLNADRNIGSVYNTLGIINLSEKRYHSAKVQFENAIEILKPLAEVHLYLPIQINLGLVNYHLGNYPLAEKLLVKSQQLGQEVKDVRNEIVALQWLSQVLEKQNKFAQALTAERRRSLLMDTTYSVDKMQAMAELNAKFETERKEKLIANQQLALRDKDYRLLRQRFLIAGLVVLVLMAIILSWMGYVRIKTRNKLALNKAVIVEQQKGIQAVIEATEQERRTIARDLHDSLAQQLAALKIGLGHFRDKNGQSHTEVLNPLYDLASQSAEEARNISHMLLPKTLITLGLAPAIRELLNRSFTPAGIAFYLDAEDAPTLDEKTNVVVYRIVQELCNNVLKHSGADLVVCRLRKNNTQFQLQFEDNGHGIDPSKIDNGLGIMNMRTRLSAIQGQIHFLAGEEQGLKVVIELPIQQSYVTA
jgi:signal transduction histidine kinase